MDFDLRKYSKEIYDAWTTFHFAHPEYDAPILTSGLVPFVTKLNYETNHPRISIHLPDDFKDTQDVDQLEAHVEKAASGDGILVCATFPYDFGHWKSDKAPLQLFSRFAFHHHDEDCINCPWDSENDGEDTKDT